MIGLRRGRAQFTHAEAIQRHADVGQVMTRNRDPFSGRQDNQSLRGTSNVLPAFDFRSRKTNRAVGQREADRRIRNSFESDFAPHFRAGRPQGRLSRMDLAGEIARQVFPDWPVRT